MIKYLGGKCIQCGISNNLHIDHINHKTKNFDVSKNWSIDWNKLKIELDLCQLLCELHHKEKTNKEGSQRKAWATKPRGLVHGTAWGYIKYKCRCDACKYAKSLTYKKSSSSNLAAPTILC